MKKKIVLVLALVLLLCGCTKGGPASNPSDTSASAAQEETTRAFSFPSAADGNQVFFTCQNYDYDYYVGHNCAQGLTFFILTRQHVDPEEITVSIPVEATYTVSTFEESVSTDRSVYSWQEDINGDQGLVPSRIVNTDFYLWLYQTYRGLDWHELGRKIAELDKLQQDDLEQSATNEIKQLTTDCNAELTRYADDYMALQKEDLPIFYLYGVSVVFQWDSAQDNEVFQNIEVQIGSEHYDVDIGEIRLNYGDIDNSMDAPDDIWGGWTGSPINMDSYPYGPCIESCRTSFTQVTEDITLTGFSLLEGAEGTAELLQAKLYIGDSAGEGGMEILWDGVSPVTVPAGKWYHVEMLIHDPRMEELCYGGFIYPQFSYSYNGEAYTSTEGVNLVRMNYEPWLWYAAGLDGLDIESYFRDYYFEVINSGWKDLI